MTTVLTLPRSGLTVEDGELLKRDRNGVVIARHALKTIRSIERRDDKDKVAIIVCLVALGLSGAAKYFIPNGMASWAAALGLLVVSSVFMLAIKRYNLRLVLEAGEVTYQLQDLPDEIQGFHVSLQGLIRDGAPSKA